MIFESYEQISEKIIYTSLIYNLDPIENYLR